MSNIKDPKNTMFVASDPEAAAQLTKAGAGVGLDLSKTLNFEALPELHEDLHPQRTAPSCVLLRNADKRGNVRVGVDQHRRIATGAHFQLQEGQVVVVAQVRPNGECCELRQSHMLTRAGKTAEVEVLCTAVKGKDPGDGVNYAHGDVVGVAWLLGTAPVIPLPQKAKEKTAEQKADGAK